MKKVVMLRNHEGLNAGEVGGFADSLADELIEKGFAKAIEIVIKKEIEEAPQDKMIHTGEVPNKSIKGRK